MLNSVDDGARELLKDTVVALSQFPNIEYVIIGGWCPVLRNKSSIQHPGTLDVDVLFRHSNDPGYLSEIIKQLIKFEFIPSAKHPFQLLKKQSINGNNLIYNIDLLHPKMLEDKKFTGTFVDHLELDIPLNSEEQLLKKVCSIVLPNSEVIFQKQMYSLEKIDGHSLPLVSFEGMFITKMDSCQKQKRERDSFDIYLAFLNDGINLDSISNLSNIDDRIRMSLDSFKKYLAEKAVEFDKNVKHFGDSIQGSPAQFVLSNLSRQPK